MTIEIQSKKDLYIFTFTASFCGEPLGDGGTDLLVGGYGDDQLQAANDAAQRLHGMGYRNVVLTPR